jgi:hypothetical protein
MRARFAATSLRPSAVSLISTRRRSPASERVRSAMPRLTRPSSIRLAVGGATAAASASAHIGSGSGLVASGSSRWNCEALSSGTAGARLKRPRAVRTARMKSSSPAVKASTSPRSVLAGAPIS